jgi:hypothetical protein
MTCIEGILAETGIPVYCRPIITIFIHGNYKKRNDYSWCKDGYHRG